MTPRVHDINDLIDRLRFLSTDLFHDEQVVLDQQLSRTNTASMLLEEAARRIRAAPDDDAFNTYSFAVSNLVASLNETIMSTFRYSALQLGLEEHINYSEKDRANKIDTSRYFASIEKNHPELARIYDGFARDAVRDLRNGAAHLDLDTIVSDAITSMQTPRERHTAFITDAHDDGFFGSDTSSDADHGPAETEGIMPLLETPQDGRNPKAARYSAKPIHLYVLPDEAIAAVTEQDGPWTYDSLMDAKANVDTHTRERFFEQTGLRYSGTHDLPASDALRDGRIATRIQGTDTEHAELLDLTYRIIEMSTSAIRYGLRHTMQKDLYGGE